MSRLLIVVCWVVLFTPLQDCVAEAAITQMVEPLRLVVQAGHTFSVSCVTYSPDGKTLASGSADKTIKLWDVASGRVLQTISGHSNTVNSVAFSPDGKTLASGSGDKTIKLWDVASGRALQTISGHSVSVVSVAFSPDGKTLASSGSYDKAIKLWDVASGRELRTLDGHSKSVDSVAFSPDGKTLVSSGNHDKTIKLWDVASGLEVRVLGEHSDGVIIVAFSPNGKTLASGSYDKTIKLWDIARGREIRTLGGHSSRVSSVAFSPDGKTLASGSADKTIKLWDVASGRELQTISGHAESVSSIAFSPYGKTLASGSTDKTIKLRDVASGRELRVLDGQASSVLSVMFSPDGKTLASGSADKTIKLWDMASAMVSRSLDGHSDGAVAFSPDGKTLATGSGDKTIKLWDVASGRELQTISGHAESVSSIAFSHDGKLLASRSPDKTIKLWNPSSGAKLRTIDDDAYLTFSLALSPDGRIVAADSTGSSIKLWDTANGRELQTLEGHSGMVSTVVFSSDGKTLASGSLDSTIKLWDVSSGREKRTLRGHTDAVFAVAFSLDGKIVASGSFDSTIKLWDEASGRELRTLHGHSIGILSIAFSADRKTLATAGLDGSVKVWRISDGALLATLTSFTDGHWAVSDPEGRFDSTNGGDNPHLHWVFENTPIDLSQLKDRYYDPGLLQKVMGYGKEPLRTVPKFEDALLHKWPEVAVSADAQNPLRLAIRLTDRGDGYGRVRVRLNGKELTANAAAGRTFSGKLANLSLDLDPERLLPGDNRIDVVAWPRVGHIPSPAAQLVVSGAATRGAFRSGNANNTASTEPVTLHAVVMGVSQYAGANMRLAFSGKDANDFASALELGGARLFGAERVRLHRFSDYATVEGTTLPTERLPSRDNLRRAFEAIAKEAKAGDILLVYLAGHGVMTPGIAGEAEYYYLSREAQSTDLSDLAVRKLWGISSTELTDWIKQIKASKQVLVLDTCAAGGAIEKLVAKRQIPGAQVIALEQLKDRTGMHILAGAAADRVSYEATQFGQGLLTYALLTGMKGAALKDEIVDVQRLFQYTRDEVPKLARQIGGIQEPRLSSPQGESFAIGRMAEDDRKKVPLAKVKPMIQRASFQDEGRMKDIFKLGQRFDDRVRLETYAVARGTLVYVDADDFPDAWQVSGRYRKEADGVRVMARLFQGDADKGAFEVLLPFEEAAQTETLLAATLKAMSKGIGGK